MPLKNPMDFFTNPEPITALKDVQGEMNEQREKLGIDLITLRRGQDWSYLNNQVVRAEVPIYNM